LAAERGRERSIERSIERSRERRREERRGEGRGAERGAEREKRRREERRERERETFGHFSKCIRVFAPQSPVYLSMLNRPHVPTPSSPTTTLARKKVEGENEGREINN
jgi:hypothetical protein